MEFISQYNIGPDDDNQDELDAVELELLKQASLGKNENSVILRDGMNTYTVMPSKDWYDSPLRGEAKRVLLERLAEKKMRAQPWYKRLWYWFMGD